MYIVPCSMHYCVLRQQLCAHMSLEHIWRILGHHLLSLQVLTRRMQLQGCPQEEQDEIDGGVKGKGKNKGKGRGKGAKGRGKGKGAKGRGRGKQASHPEEAEPVPSTEPAEEIEASESTQKKAPKAKAKSNSKAKAAPKRKGQAVETVETSGNAAAAGSNDGSEIASAPPAVVPAPKRKRQRRAAAAEEQPAQPPHDPAQDPGDVPIPPADHGPAPNDALLAPAEGDQAGDLPVAAAEEAPQDEPEGQLAGGLSQTSREKLQHWKRCPERWRSFNTIYCGMYSEPKPENMIKLSYYTLSMYWKTARVGLVHKPGKTHVLSFSSAGTKLIGLPLSAAMEYVQTLSHICACFAICSYAT